MAFFFMCYVCNKKIARCGNSRLKTKNKKHEAKITKKRHYV